VPRGGGDDHRSPGTDGRNNRWLAADNERPDRGTHRARRQKWRYSLSDCAEVIGGAHASCSGI
jgi:hypothetical protein